ncbi:EpsG family protein [Enterovibrio norvegicus]|uniref:EpsG family protein n=1 Tax=Enterovibrio norvegicus TaxID=188144 RepID=UPI00389AD488
MNLKSICAIPISLVSSPAGFIYSVFYSDVKIVAFCSSLMIALVAFTMHPYQTMDLARYYDSYFILDNINADNIQNYYSVNLAVYYLIKYFSFLGLKKEFIPFFFTFISYIVTFLSYNICVEKKNLNNKEKLTLVFLVFCTALFFGAASGLRNGLSSSLALLAIASSFSGKNKIIVSFLFLFSILIHPFAILIYLTYLLASFLKNEKIYNIIITFALSLSLVNSSGIVANIVELLLPSTMSKYIVSEFINNDIVGFDSEKTFVNVVVFYLSQFLMLLSSLLILVKIKNDSILTRCASLLLSLSLLFFNFPIFFERYSNVLFMVVGIIAYRDFIYKERLHESLYYRRLITVFFIALSLNSFFQFYRFRYIFFDGLNEFLNPTFFVFLSEVDFNNLRLF